MAQSRLNLRGATTLLVDSDAFTRGLIAQMLRGFGMDTPTTYDTGAAAKAHLLHHYIDLCILEAVLPDMDCAQLIRWIRRQDKSPLRFIPIIVLTSYTQHRHVAMARDSGANLIVKKPVSPRVLYDRIAWVAKTSRPFIETASYAGPDRRFRTLEPLDGKHKRETDFAEGENMQSVPEQNERAGAEPSPKRVIAS